MTRWPGRRRQPTVAGPYAGLGNTAVPVRSVLAGSTVAVEVPPSGGGPAEGGSGRSATPGHRWTAGAALGTRVVSGVAVLAMVTGPLALGVAVIGWRQPAPAAVPVAADADLSPVQPVTVAAFAEAFVEAWLQSSRRSPGPLQAYLQVDESQLPSEAVGGVVVTAVAVVAVGEGRWHVDVAATPAPVVVAAGDAGPAGPSPDPATAEGTNAAPERYYRVVTDTSGGLPQVAALPFPVPAPLHGMSGGEARTAYRYDVPVEDPLATSVDGWLRAYLLGEGDPGRFLAPGVEVGRVDGYDAVDVIEIRSDTTAEDLVSPVEGQEVRVSARAAATEPPPIPAATAEGPPEAPEAPEGPEGPVEQTTSSVEVGRTVTVQAGLQLQLRQGRWEITAHDLGAAGVVSPTTASQPATVPSAVPSISREVSRGDEP